MLQMILAFACIYSGSVQIQGAGVPLPDPMLIQGEVPQCSLQPIFMPCMCARLFVLSEFVLAVFARHTYRPCQMELRIRRLRDVQSYVLHVLGCTHTHKRPVPQPEEPCLWIEW